MSGSGGRGLMRRLTGDALVAAWGWVGRAGVVGSRSRHGRRFQAVGDGSAFAFPPGPSMGERWIRIGADTLVGPGVSLTAGMWPGEPFVPEPGWSIRIGDRCNIGRNVAIAGRVGIDIGDDVTIAPNVYITDHNHDYADPAIPISRQWLVEDPVVVGSGSWLGAGVVVLPGARIGGQVAVAAGSVVRGVVPDRSVVAGVPAKVVRRWSEKRGWEPPLPDRQARALDRMPPGWFDTVAR